MHTAQDIIKHTMTTRGATHSRVHDISIDSLRGVAVLLMVAGHVIGSASDQGMYVSDESLWRFSYIALEDIRMPLFAVLSGYIYARRPVHGPQAVMALVKGKSRRLLVPLLTVGTAFLCAQLVIPVANANPDRGDFWRMFVYGGHHLWFVQAMFLIFLVVGALDALDALNSFERWLLALAAGSLLFTLITIPEVYDFFSLSGAIRLLPFFLLGYGLKKFSVTMENRRVFIVSVVAFGAVYAIRIFTVVNSCDVPDPLMRLLKLVVGIFAIISLMLFRERLRSRPLAWLGGYSYAIYLLHLFASAGSGKLLGSLGVDNNLIIFAVGMFFAVGLPVLFERTFGKVNWVSWAVLGQRAPRGTSARR